MKKFGPVLLVLIGVAGAAAFLFWKHSPAPEAQPVPVASVLSPATESSPGVQFPVPSEDVEETGTEAPSPSAARKSVPSLDESDPTIEQALFNLIGKERFEALFHREDIVRRMVVTIDNSSAHRQPSQELSCLKSLDSSFRVSGKGDALAIDPANFERYKPFAELARAIDATKLVSVYVHFYKLFQAAYADLGTQAYFNDRVVQVIDHILKTPDVNGPIQLVPAEVVGRYKYADPDLESRSAVQKALIRMGTENSGVIKEKLREIRERLVHLRKR